MRVLFLSNNENTKRLYKWLQERCEITWFDKKITLLEIEKYKPELIVSYNYKYMIGESVIEKMNGNILNLHISYLPWNKGSNPNFWSFVEDTPKGVSIHRVSAKLDEGGILFQKEVKMDPEQETFTTSYNKLHDSIVELFMENWEDIRCQSYPVFPQKGEGSFHNQREFLNITEKYPLSWDENIGEYLKRMDR